MKRIFQEEKCFLFFLLLKVDENIINLSLGRVVLIDSFDVFSIDYGVLFIGL